MPNKNPVASPRAVAFDLLSFLALAVTVALASAVVLVAAVLLFASRAQAAETPGMLVLRTADGREAAAAPLLSTDVVFRVSGMVVRAHVVQTFENASADWVEGVYVFPLPEDAAVDRLQLRVGERLIEGEIRERAAAQRTYERAKAAGRRTALMDQERPNVFTTRVANIGPRETIAVEFEYQQTLRYEDGRYSMRFPMVVGPRYVPRALKVSAGNITPPVLRPEAGPVNRVRLRVELDAGVPLARIESPYQCIAMETLSETRGRAR